LFNYVKLERGVGAPLAGVTWNIIQQEYQSLDPLTCLLLPARFPSLNALGVCGITTSTTTSSTTSTSAPVPSNP
ncbi:hypothetical protein OESDEN_14725, partial [Oesophagostomum dentatum]